jgi:thiol:disulfide interchange protein
MRKVFLLLFTTALFLSQSSVAQILNPSSWSWKAEQTAKGEYKIIVTAKIDKGWHTYSQFLAEGGPVATALTFDKDNKDIQLIGKTTETSTKVHSGHDPVFDMQLKYFENDLTLEQKVKVLKDTKLKVALEFMMCDDKSCLPPDLKEFEFDLKAGVAAPVKDSAKTKTQGVLDPAQIAFDSAVQAGIEQGMKNEPGEASLVAAAPENKFGKPLQDCGPGMETDDKSLFAIIVLGFLGGLLALITPCVFPMIPLTVSF